MSLLRILVTRLARKKDPFLPTHCNAQSYSDYLYHGAVCDCKIYCKYPLRGDIKMEATG